MNLHIKYISYVSSIIVLIFVYVINFYPNYSLNQELHLFETISVGLFVLFAITYRSTNNLKFIFDFLTRIKRSVSKEYSRNKYFLKSISLLFFVLLAAKQLLFINKYTVNMLYWDQWDFYNPLFNNETLWQAFTHQHGPHRQGIGFILTEFLAKESGWNTRWDAFGISFCLIFSAFIAISILLKSSINNAFYLVLVPLAFFTPHSWEMLVGPSNISHGAMPVLLIMLYCLTLFSGKPLSRWFCLLSINFCCVFTGFGLFIGLITPLLAILELIQSIKLRRIHYTAITTISFVLSILTWALFFKDYKFADTAPSGPSTFYSKIKFTALLLSHFYGASHASYISLFLGYALVIVFTYIIALSTFKLIKNNVIETPFVSVIFCLSVYTLFYCAGTAYGRAGSTDLNAWSAPRYVTLLIPGVFALILFFTGWIRSTIWSIILCLSLSIGMFHLASYEKDGIEYFSNGRKAWKDIYLKTGDALKADKISNFQVYPANVLDYKLNYLKKNKLNLFQVDPK